MVEVRAELPDLPKLAEVCRELARHVVPGDVARRVENPRRLVVRVGRAEIGEQPGAKPLGLADVDHPAHGVRHPVDGRPVLRQRADALAELLEVGGGERDGPLRPAGGAHDWQRWQKTEMRASIRCVPVSRVPQRRHGSPSRP